MGNRIDRTGQRFGRLTVVRLASPIKTDTAWLCLCDCGNEIAVKAQALSSRAKQSCGCGLAAIRESRPSPLLSVETAKDDPSYVAKRAKIDEQARRCMYSGYRASAAQRGLPFSVSRDDFVEMTKQPCYYCGALPTARTWAGYAYAANGVDRVNNALGYIEGNMEPCCTPCNMAKKGMDAPDFIAWALQLADNVRAKFCQTEEN